MERVRRQRGETVWSLDYLGRQAPVESERSDAARNRQKILRAAQVLFDERGVTSVTMEEIARASGVGKGTLYRRFPHKGFLCQALLDEPTRGLQERTLALLSEPGSSAPRPRSLKITQFARYSCLTAVVPTARSRVLPGQWPRKGAGVRLPCSRTAS